MNTKFKEKTWEIVFLFAAAFSILAVLLICLFLFANGIPAMHKIGWLDFLFGKTWKPGNEQFGIFPMIVGSLYVTAGAIIFGVPIGLMTAIFLSKFCSKKLKKYLKIAIDLLAGIPSVVYGFFGNVSFKDGKIFSPENGFATTRMLGSPEAMAFEELFIDILSNADKFSLKDNLLSFEKSIDKSVLTFSK